MSRYKEPCMCGDPDCRRCFPGSHYREVDEDEAYEAGRQKEIDDQFDTLEERREAGGSYSDLLDDLREAQKLK